MKTLFNNMAATNVSSPRDGWQKPHHDVPDTGHLTPDYLESTGCMRLS